MCSSHKMTTNQQAQPRNRADSACRAHFMRTTGGCTPFFSATRDSQRALCEADHINLISLRGAILFYRP